MKSLIRIGSILVVLGAAGAASYNPLTEYWKKRNRPTWRVAEVTRGNLIFVVNSTGTVKPVLSIQVGSFVSGPIEAIHVDFNDEVKKGDVLAEIDPRLFKADEARDRAFLANARAQVQHAKAQLQQAINDENRAMALQAENEDFISDSELDQVRFQRAALEAQVDIAEASVQQALASLERSLSNVEYTKITAPDDGIIIERKIEPGQTLAASFQTPEMFVLAPRMREKMYIFASVDEADIGLVRSAKDHDQPVQFTVDAYPDVLFEGVIEQIRISSATTQNVVTYPVIVAAANPDLKLWPGMTASISFRIEEKADVIKIPNAALRFYPDIKHVRPEDRKILEGAEEFADDKDEPANAMLSAAEKAEARRKRNRRHVWLADGEFLKAVEVTTGLSDNKYSELVSGNIQHKQELVTGIKPKEKRF